MDFDESTEQLNADISEYNIFSSPTLISKNGGNEVLSGYKEELTTKRAVELLLEGTLKTKVCRYCLSIVPTLSELDQILQVAGTGALHKVTIREMVASFYPFKVEPDQNFPNKICNKCLNRAISAYLFTQQCERSERALRNCFDDMYEKLDKLDPLERTNKRGRQKKYPNYNTLYTEHEKVIDYAQPIMNIVNVKSVSLSKETFMTELECPKCWQLFTNIEDLMVHERSHTSSMWFNCRLCGKSFVKRLQLKRHLKQAHVSLETGPKESQDDSKFHCKTCDSTSHDYGSHLQHMEKHKFQMVLEHLVEKDMDKLCAVCLGKDPKLVDLDKMVRLHGGYPGVTGDKTLYSILGSTLPDRKSYKYQELHVPSHAKIMKITKLTKARELRNTLDHAGKNENENTVNNIIISNPLVISNENIDYDETYLFFFSNASSCQKEKGEFKSVIASLECKKVETEISETNMKKLAEKPHQKLNAKNLSNTFIFNGNQAFVNDYQNEINITDKFILNYEGMDGKDAVFFEPTYELKEFDSNSKSKDTGGIKTGTKMDLCKTCWIFRAPTCATCINNLKLFNVNKIANLSEKTGEENTKINCEIARDDCKYCWIFKSSGKCDFCKKITVAHCTKTKGDSKDDKKTVTSNEDDQRERKFTGPETNSKKKKWDCDICLITNLTDRQTCVCCGSNRHDQNETVKVNWQCTDPFKSTPVNNHMDWASDKMDVENESNFQHTEETLETTHQSNNFTNKLLKVSDNVAYSTENALGNDEKMDISDLENCEIMIPVNPNSCSMITSVTNEVKTNPSSFQFHLGAGSSNEKRNRRIMKPIRKMAYHK